MDYRHYITGLWEVLLGLKKRKKERKKEKTPLLNNLICVSGFQHVPTQ